jgi:transcriptional regulator with GAF, ATPase, and Fis domain
VFLNAPHSPNPARQVSLHFQGDSFTQGKRILASSDNFENYVKEREFWIIAPAMNTTMVTDDAPITSEEIEIAVVAMGSVLEPQHLPDFPSIAKRQRPQPKLAAGTRDQLEAALRETGGNCKAAAKLLNWSVPRVYRRVKKYQLSYLLPRPRD